MSNELTQPNLYNPEDDFSSLMTCEKCGADMMVVGTSEIACPEGCGMVHPGWHTTAKLRRKFPEQVADIREMRKIKNKYKKKAAKPKARRFKEAKGQAKLFNLDERVNTYEGDH